MGNRNPNKPHQYVERNERRTIERIEQYHGKVALLATWDEQPNEVQIRNHDYLLALRKTVRQVKMYVLHRADPNADL